MSTGTSVRLSGEMVDLEHRKQAMEMQVKTSHILGTGQVRGFNLGLPFA